MPASIAPRECPRCGTLVGELEVVADIGIEETAGVGGTVTGVGLLFAGTGETIEGPHLYTAESFLQGGVPRLRVNPRGILTLPEVGVHFAPTLRARLPGALSFTVHFRDDHGHTISRDVVIQVTQ